MIWAVDVSALNGDSQAARSWVLLYRPGNIFYSVSCLEPSDLAMFRRWRVLYYKKAFEELYDYCCAVAGASIHAADRLCRGEADVAINWGGGR